MVPPLTLQSIKTLRWRNWGSWHGVSAANLACLIEHTSHPWKVGFGEGCAFQSGGIFCDARILAFRPLVSKLLGADLLADIWIGPLAGEVDTECVRAVPGSCASKPYRS
jgi:hypothetical protein